MAHIDEELALASGARTTTQTLGPYPEVDAGGEVRAVEVVLNLTAFTTAASLTLSIEEDVTGAGTWVTSIAGVAVTANGASRIRLGPDFPISANASQTGLIPGRWRVVVTHGNANSHTYSVLIRRERR